MYSFNQASWKEQILGWLHAFVTVKAVSVNGSSERNHAVWNHVPQNSVRPIFVKRSCITWQTSLLDGLSFVKFSKQLGISQTQLMQWFQPCEASSPLPAGMQEPQKAALQTDQEVRWICPTFLRIWISFSTPFRLLFEPLGNTALKYLLKPFLPRKRN